MRLFALLLGLVSFVQVYSKEAPKYPVSAIPENLRKDANVVVRLDETVFRIISKSKAVYRVHMVATIFNEKGKRYAYETVGYDKLTKVTSLKGASYDVNGELIRRLKASEIYDQSAYDGFSVFSDNRFKAADLSQGEYPYTVDFEYEVEYKFLFIIPGSYLYGSQSIAVENFIYTLEFPDDLAPRYKATNISVEPEKGKTKDGLSFVSWRLTNQLPMKPEPLGPASEEIIPNIAAAPSVFEYDGYAGSQTSWEGLGQWISSLNAGRNKIPEATQAKVREIAASLPTTEAKVKAIYEYMQSRTRYVSIQLGIGGFQPFDATVVDQTGYGDCKALSNYMVSLLGVVGIKSHYTLIEAGDDAGKLKTDFPSSQFNHAVVCVPNGADTLWLECTSQTNPFGYMGTFTGDRKALAITDNGAVVVSTPRYPGNLNTQNRTATVTVDDAGNATAHVSTTYSGLLYEKNNLHFILDNQYDEQKKWVQTNTQIPSFDIGSFKMKNIKNKIPAAVVDLDLKLPRLASVSGKRIFITPNLMNRFTYMPEKIESRKTNVVRRYAQTSSDTIRYKMPDGVYPEFLPEPVKVTSRFGEYESSVTIDQGDVIYVRRLKMNAGEFPPETYNEFIDFCKSVGKADTGKLVFLSKT